MPHGHSTLTETKFSGHDFAALDARAPGSHACTCEDELRRRFRVL